MARTQAEIDETGRAFKQLMDDEDRDGWEPMDAPPLPDLPTRPGQVIATFIPKKK